jgi:hypothetical protein
MSRITAIADAAHAAIRVTPGADTTALARELDVDVNALAWVLHRCGRSLGVGQHVDGAWWDQADSPEIRSRLEALLPPSFAPLEPEPDWSTF